MRTSTMLLPPEIWNEIVQHTVKDVLKFECNNPGKPEEVYFTFIVNNSKLLFYNPNLPNIKVSLQELIDGMDKIEKTCLIPIKDPLFDASTGIIINTNLAKNVFNIELKSLLLTSTYTMEFEKNKKMIVKFLTDFRDAL